MSDNPFFSPNMSSDELYVGQDMTMCLTDTVLGKADINHTHNEYASASHTHTGYATQSDLDLLEDVVDTKANTSHTHSGYATASHTHNNYATVTALDTLSDEVDGKANTNHNHNSSYISKSLQMTTDDGNAELQLMSGSTSNLLTKIAALGMGMHTFYSASGIAGNPKDTEAWRGIIFKTGTNFGFVQAYGSIGSVYTNYLDGSNGWRGWKCVWDNNPEPLWSGKYYMHSPNSTPQTVTPSKKLSECRNGWLLLWSDYDADTSTANDADFVTTMIPKRNPTGGTWGGKSFLCDIPRHIGSDPDDVTTEKRIIKPIYVHDDCIKGSYQNASGTRNDVVLRAVYEY